MCVSGAVGMSMNGAAGMSMNGVVSMRVGGAVGVCIGDTVNVRMSDAVGVYMYLLWKSSVFSWDSSDSLHFIQCIIFSKKTGCLFCTNAYIIRKEFGRQGVYQGYTPYFTQKRKGRNRKRMNLLDIMDI